MKISGKRDPQSPEAKAALESRVDEASRMYEKQFLREMVKAMRSATSATGFVKPTMAEGIYRDQLDEQYVEAWGDKGGLGLHKLIHDQLMEMVAPSRTERPRGPIPLTDRDVLRSSAISPRALRVDLAQGKPGAPLSNVSAALGGEIASIERSDGRAAVAVDTPSSKPGAAASRSTYVFEGAPSADLKTGDQVAPGQAIGALSPDARALIVNVRRGE